MKVLFVRISPTSHDLLRRITAHDAVRHGTKASLRASVERLISESAATRRIGPSPTPSETEKEAAASQEKVSSETDTPRPER